MLSSKLIRLFLDMRANDLLPQADLLLEMLDAQETFDSSHNFLTLPSESNPANSSTTSKNYNQPEENKTPDATNSKIFYSIGRFRLIDDF